MAEVLTVVGRVTGAPVTADARLETDLGMDSLELAALAAELRGRFGSQVDLGGYLAGLELDDLIDLTAGQLAEHLADRLPESPAMGARAKSRVNK